MSSEDRRQYADQIRCTEIAVNQTPDGAFVSNLGNASYVLSAVKDRDLNFYLWGSMGVTTPTGLGLAIATDRPVTVLDGDGSMLMSLGALATVANCDPPNLTIVVWDNEQYGTTGGQSTLSATTDFAAVAEGVGLRSYHVTSTDAFETQYSNAVSYDGATLIVCRVDPVDPESRPPFDFAHIKRRFRSAVNEQ